MALFWWSRRNQPGREPAPASPQPAAMNPEPSSRTGSGATPAPEGVTTSRPPVGIPAQAGAVSTAAVVNPLTPAFSPPDAERDAGLYPRPVQNVFEAQVSLARQGISSGSIDGLIGPQTRAALRVFQQKENLPTSGELDAATKERLVLTASPLCSYKITAADLARLQPLSSTWLGKSQQTAL